MIIESGRARKIIKGSLREGRHINVHDELLKKGCCLRIALNRTGSIFNPNNEYLKRSRAKIIKGALPGGTGILACMDGCAKEVAVSESCEIAWVA